MNDLALQELISAYLDGELTASEQARVEQALVENPRCRQIHDDFVALRNSLQSLPREELDPDFTRRVMERIRQTPPKPADAGANQQGAACGPTIVIVSDKSHPAPACSAPRGRTSRFVERPLALWIGLAVAAVLLAIVGYFPLHWGYRFWQSGGREPLGANSHSPRQEGVIPENPESAFPVPDRALADGERTPRREPGDAEVRTPVAEADPGSPRPNATGQFAQQSPESPTPATPATESPPSTLGERPQVALTNAANPPSPTAVATKVAQEEEAWSVDFRQEALHVMHLAAAPDSFQRGAFDQLLTKHRIPFVSTERRNAQVEIDIVFVEAKVATLERVYEELKRRPPGLRLTAVYRKSLTSFYELLVPLAIVSDVPLPAGLAGDSPHAADPMPESDYAWRAPPDRAVFEPLLTPDDRPLASVAAPGAKKSWALFVLTLEK